jgi:hypothetical protein
MTASATPENYTTLTDVTPAMFGPGGLGVIVARRSD